MLSVFSLLALLLSLSTSSAVAKDRLVEAKVLELRPTQMNLGIDVEARSIHKKKKARHKFRRHVIREIKDEPPVVVKGPGGELFLIDGHHRTRDAFDAGLESIQVEIKDDLSDLSEREFWKKMEENKWVWLYDKNGEKVSISQLPRRIDQLTFDPWRKFAPMVRNAGGYVKSPVPFQYFYWGALFRKNLKIIRREDGTINFEAMIPKALALAKSEKASELPGYFSCPKRFKAVKRSLKTEIFIPDN